MIDRPIIKYVGSKFTMARYYPPPQHDVVVGAFAGGAGYEIRHHEKQVVLCDTNATLIETWQWLIGQPLDELRSLPTNALREGEDIRRYVTGPAADLIRRWQRVGRNDCWTVSKWNCKTGQWGDDVVQALLRNIPKISHWKAVHGSYLDLPDIDATWFVDPLYQLQPPSMYGCKPLDYGQLAEWCLSRKGQVIVCEQAGAKWLEFEPISTRTGGSRSNGGKPYTEVWCHTVDGQVVTKETMEPLLQRRVRASRTCQTRSS